MARVARLELPRQAPTCNCFSVKEPIISGHLSRRRRLVRIGIVVFGDDIVDIRGVDSAIEVPDVGSGYWVLGRSVKSVRKISPGPRFVFGTTSEAESGLQKCEMTLNCNPPGKSA